MITTRPLEPTDLEAVVALVHADDRRWFGKPLLAPEDARAEWERPGFDLATSSEGWFDDEAPGGAEALVAAATLTDRGDLVVVVDEAWEGAGLEEALLRRWEDEARRRGLPTLHRDLSADDAQGLALLAARGWQVEEAGWILRLDASTALEAAALPSGYAVRPVLEADLPEVHRVVTEAFARYGPSRSYEDWRSGMVGRPDVTLDHWRLATHGGAVVGAGLVQDPLGVGEGEAWVPQLAVVPEHRRRGLARELLVQVALAARERGVARLGLFTYEATGAIGLYERLGMRVVHRLRTCTLEL